MTDFNLSAAISLQLATNAGSSLAEQINKAVNAANIQDRSVKINPVIGTMTAQLKRMFPESAATPAKVKLSLSVSNPKEVKKIEDLMKDKSIKIDVEFSDKAKKAIDDFSTSLSKLRESSKGFEELQKLVKYMNDVGKVDLADLGPSEGKIKSRAAKISREYEGLIKAFEKLSEDAKKSSQGKEGEFVPFALDRFKQLRNEFKSVAAEAERFGGVNGKASKNALFAIEAVFKAYKDLEVIKRRTEKSGLSGFDDRIVKNIEKAQNEAYALLASLDSIEQIPLAASISAIVSPIKDANREAGQYRSLLSAIKKEQAEALATGASDSVVTSLKERMRLVEQARANNIPINSLKEGDDYQNNIGQTKNLNNVQRAALKASLSIEKFRSESELSGEFNTQGAALSNMKKRLEDITKDFEDYYKVQAASNNPNAATNITENLARYGIGVKDLKAEIKDFDTVLKNFDDKKAFYDEKGLTQSAAMVEKAKLQFIELQKTQAQGRLNTSNNFYQQTNQGIEAFAENEKKLAKFITTLDRLKASLSFSLGGGEDFSGVGVGLDNLQKKVEGSLGNFDERKIKDTIASDSYMLRAKEKQNKVINAAISSFEQAASDSADSGPGRATLGPVAFAGRGEDLNKFVRTLNLTSNSYKDIGKNIDIVKSKANELYALASIEADGGFIGSITKSLGLAAKRLTTFLFAARAIYGIQNAIIEATGSAVELDTEFTRLEQIFAGSQERIGSVEKNIQSLSSEILTLASNYGVAATEIAKSADIFAQAGIQGRNLQKILEISTKASVGPTFGSNIEISEAVIASMNQFRISADDMADVIGGISQVSAQFAVESDGITKAIRRAGGAFAAAKADGQSYMGALADFVGAFTVLKEQTREADETLATSLRNVLNRLQRSNVRKYLKENFDINLLDSNNQFIGFARSIELVSAKIKELGIKSGDPRFAELVQKLAGSLQSSRLTSLLSGASDISKAVAEFQRGGESLDRDAAIAFNSLENKLTRAKSAVVDLMTTIARSDALKTMIELFVVLTQTVTGAVKAFLNFGGALGLIVKGLGAISLAKTAISIVPKIVTRGISGLTQSGILGPARGFNTGGLIPGTGPNIDTEPYMLTKGEYVVNRHSVQKYGKSFFNDLNSGKINYAATGSGPNGMISGGDTKTVYKGVLGLVKLFKDLGVEIFGLTNILADFEISPDLAEKAGNRGQYEYNKNNPNKTGKITLDKDKGANLFVASHEVGHAVQETSRKKQGIYPDIPQNILATSNARIGNSYTPYKDNYHTKDQENFADTFAATIQDLSGQKPDPANAGFFKGFLSEIKRTLGLVVQPVGADTRYEPLPPKAPARKPQQVIDQSKDFIDSLSPEMNKVLTVLSSNKDNPVISGDPIVPQRAKKQVTQYSSALDDIINPVKSVFKGLADGIKNGLGMLRDAADSAMPLSGLERFNNNPEVITGEAINVPQVQNPARKSARKQPKTRISEREFEREFIRFAPAGPQNYEKGVKQGPPRPTKQQREAVQRTGYGKPGRYEFDGVNPPLPKGERIDPPPFVPGKEKVKIESGYSGKGVSFETLDLMNKRRQDNGKSRKAAAAKREQEQYEKEQAFFNAVAPPVNPPSKPPTFGGLGYPTNPPGGGGSGPRNPNPPSGGSGPNGPNGPKPPGGGGSPPATLLSGSSIFEKLFANAGKLSLVFGAVTGALGYYANSSKEASEKVKVLSDAAIAAALAITTFTIASNSASSIGSGVKNLFSGKGGAGGGIATDTTKGFGGGGFFDKYATNKPASINLPSAKGGKGFISGAGNLLKGLKPTGLGNAASFVKPFKVIGEAAVKAAKFLGPQVLGAAVVGLVAAMGSFNDAAIKASEDIIANSTSEKEVVEERANIDKRKGTSRGLGVLGKVAGGAAIGSMAGPVGAAVGAAAGFFAGLFTQFTDSKIGNILSDGLKEAGEWVSAIATVLGGGLGWLADKLDNAFAAAASVVGLGPDETKIQEKKDRQANLDKAGANLNSFNRGAKRTGGATQEEFGNLLKSVKQTSASASGFKSLGDSDKEKVKGQAEKLKSALDGANEFQRGTIIDAAKKSGIDIKKMFEDMGLEFDEIGPKAAIASDKLSKMFAEMQSVTDRVGSVITNFNVGNEAITNKAAGIAGEGTTGGVSSGVFDQLRKGGTPTGEAAVQTNKLFADLEKFSPAAALNARTENAGARAAFSVSNQLAGKDIKLGQGKGGDEVGGIIGDMFDKAMQGQPKEVQDRLGGMLDNYLDTQQEALNGAVGNGKVNNEKVGEIINGFTDSIKRGGIDTAEAFNSSNQQFKQAMDGIIKRRIEYEGKITDLAKSNVDKQKTFIEFQNKASGKSDTDVTLQQARGLDSQKRGIALRGTGLGGNASVADMRTRYDELTAQDPGGNDPQIQAFKDSIYEELQNAANGTDSFTAAMREFDKASEKAKMRTEQLSDALLGTDENLFNTLKGIQLQQRVSGAKNSGEAFLALQNTDDASKQALQQRLNSDPEAKRAFETKLGIAPNLVASPQAAAVAGELGTQVDAGNALIGINQDLSNQMTGLAGELVKNRASFEQFGLQINNFANAANKLADNLGAIPQNIAHAHTFTVEPIQVSITGAEALAKADGPFKGMITEIVNSKIGEFANNLKSKNKGLTVDALTGNTATA